MEDTPDAPDLEHCASWAEQQGYAYSDEFAFGLELILDDLEQARDTA